MWTRQNNMYTLGTRTHRQTYLHVFCLCMYVHEYTYARPYVRTGRVRELSWKAEREYDGIFGARERTRRGRVRETRKSEREKANTVVKKELKSGASTEDNSQPFSPTSHFTFERVRPLVYNPAMHVDVHNETQFCMETISERNIFPPALLPSLLLQPALAKTVTYSCSYTDSNAEWKSVLDEPAVKTESNLL